VKEVCDLYEQAQELHHQSTHLISCDEMTSIQAIERKAPTKPMKPGIIERREFEYIRHGTLSLIANFEVATGRVLSPSLGPTRTEADFLTHIQTTIETDPQGEWIFIVDQLNTHKSASLVRLVASQCGIDVDLGKKGKAGILKSMASRSDFLKGKSHRIRFVYVPKHTSWLNQIEIWFSILVRRVLKRGSFASVEELHQRIVSFISYFNQTMAKPFKWTYKGRPLTV
jgi:transposase